MGIMFDLLTRDSIPGKSTRERLERIAISFGLELIPGESDDDLRMRICREKERLRYRMEHRKNHLS